MVIELCFFKKKKVGGGGGGGGVGGQTFAVLRVSYITDQPFFVH